MLRTNPGFHGMTLFHCHRLMLVVPLRPLSLPRRQVLDRAWREWSSTATTVVACVPSSALVVSIPWLVWNLPSRWWRQVRSGRRSGGEWRLRKTVGDVLIQYYWNLRGITSLSEACELWLVSQKIDPPVVVLFVFVLFGQRIWGSTSQHWRRKVWAIRLHSSTRTHWRMAFLSLVSRNSSEPFRATKNDPLRLADFCMRIPCFKVSWDGIQRFLRGSSEYL